MAEPYQEFAYPTFEVAASAAKALVAKLRGESVDPCCLLRAAWCVLGFALAQIPHAHADSLTTYATPVTVDEEIAILENAFAQKPIGMFPWPLLIQIILAILQGLFKPKE